MQIRPRNTKERNYWFLYLDAFLSPFTGIAGAFAGAYAIRLGATNTEIGLMSSLPPLLVILVALPFGRILQTSSHKGRLALGGISLYRIGYMLFALSPLAIGTALSPTVVFIFLYILVAAPIQFYNIGNVGMMVSIVPEEDRATVFSVRNMIGSVVNIGGVFTAGQALSRMAFPGNYQLLFIVAGFVAFLSLFAWLSIRYPQDAKKTDSMPLTTIRKPSFLEQAREITTIFKGQPGFARFTVNTLLMNAGMWTAGPLYVLYTVRQLGASDAWIGTAGTVASICGLVGWMVGRRLIKTWGDGLALRRLVMVNGLYPILVGLSPSLSLIMAIGGLNSLLTPGFALSNYNIWLKVLPADRREDATAIYYTILNFGPFIFPLLGVTLASHFGISPTLVGCGLVALLGSASFSIWQVKEPDRKIMATDI